jgi:hypothetical protein
MKLSELYAQLQDASDDVLNYTLFFAAPDPRLKTTPAPWKPSLP